MSAAVALVLAGAFGAATAPRASAAESAAAVFGGCLQEKKVGDILLLVDESGSLKDTDPTNSRVAAAHDLVEQLAESTAAAKITLTMAVARFASGFEITQNWTPLDASGLARTTDELDSYANRNSGIQTDYWTGLSGARRALAARAKGGDRCQAIVWFSDGRFDVGLDHDQAKAEPDATQKPYLPDGLDLTTKADADRAADLARKDLCRGGGIADQLRAADVTLFAVGLSPSGDNVEFDPMKGIATGSDVDGKPCGRRSDPVPGSFTLAKDIDGLLFAFRRLVRPGVSQTKGVCQSLKDLAGCKAFGHAFVLDNSLTGVHVDGTSDNADGVVVVFDPTGKPTVLERKTGEATADGIRYQWVGPKTLSIDLTRPKSPAQPWRGGWSVAFVDPQGRSPQARSTTNISVSGNVLPTWPNTGATATKVYAGESASLQLRLVETSGRIFRSASLLGTGSLRARLTGPAGQELGTATIDARAVDTTPFVVDLSQAPAGRGVLELNLQITTAPFSNLKGTALTPQVVRIPVDVLPPPGVPQIVGPAAVDFGTLVGPANADATLTVRGPGCIWRDPAQAVQITTSPEEIGAVAITSARDGANCLRLADGEEQQLTLHLSTAQAGNSALSGTLPLSVASSDRPDRATTVEVAFTAELTKPVRVLDFVAALIAAIVLGVGLPWGLLVLAKYLTAKIPGRALLVESIPVTVEGGEVLRDGVPLAVQDRDFNAMVPLKIGGSRRTDAAGLTLSTHIGLSPFGAGYVLAESPGARALSSTDPVPHGKQAAARLPLAVHNRWIAVKDAAAGPGQVRIVLFADVDSGTAGRQRLADDVRRRLPQLIGTLEPNGNPGDHPGGSAGARDPFDLDGGPPPTTLAGFDQDWFPAPAPPDGERPAAGRPSAGPAVPDSAAPAAEPPTSPGADPTPSDPSPAKAGPADSPPPNERPTFSFDFDDEPGR